MAMPKIAPSLSTTWANTRGSGPNREAVRASTVFSTASGSRS